MMGLASLWDKLFRRKSPRRKIVCFWPDCPEDCWRLHYWWDDTCREAKWKRTLEGVKR